MNEPAKLVSIIIPVHNRREELLNCLKSLKNQREVAYEIIILDDAGTDNIEAAVKTLMPETKIINAGKRYGPSFLRNLGILNSAGEYLLFLDSDTVLPDTGVLKRLVQALKRDSSLGSIGGEIFTKGDRNEAIGRKIGRLGQNSPVRVSRDSPPKDCDYLATCNCFVSRKTALTIGGFDHYFFFGAEDKDFGFRIKKNGFRNLTGYGFGVFHLRTATSRLPDETLFYHITNRRFVLKNSGWGPLAVLLLKDMLWLIFFYPLLPLKIVYKKTKKIRIGRESFTAPWLVLRAYAWNFKNAGSTIKSRTANFLHPAEMAKFKRWGEQNRIL